MDVMNALRQIAQRRRLRRGSFGPLDNLGLSNSVISESSVADDVVGYLTNITSGSSISLIDSAGSRFALSGTSIVRGTTALNYSASSVHLIVVRETLLDFSRTTNLFIGVQQTLSYGSLDFSESNNSGLLTLFMEY